MDNFKPKRGGFRNRASAANAAIKKSAITNLYQQSEYAKEDSAKQAADDELVNVAPAPEPEPAPAPEKPSTSKDKLDDIDLDADIENFIDNTEAADETDVPIKKSELKKEKRRQVRAAKKAVAGHRIAIIIVLLLIFGGLGAGAYFLFRPQIEETVADSTDDNTSVADEIFYSALTGREVNEQSKVHAATTCIMIENSTEARPQSGLNQAGIIYEAIAEGGITRFMAVFQDTKPDYIGPVRSVRMTYAEIAKSYHCSIAHVGGSGNALKLIRGSNEYRDIDQFFNGDYYWRIKGRAAPHNVYTDFEHLDKLNFSKGYESSEYTGFARIKADTEPDKSGEAANTIRITMAGDPSYNPVYTYDANSNTYLRAHTRGGNHMSANLDGSTVQNAPDVVIAAKVTPVARPKTQYFDYATTGTNDVYIFQNGTVTVGK